MKININKFKQDSKSKVFIYKDYKKFSYSDGDKNEKRILEILSDVVNKSCMSDEIERKITDWISEYHFSPLRHNLFRHIPIAKTDKILELGSGCGAITRFLGEKKADVYTVEGSLLRAKCTAIRCSDLPNVKVYCSNFEDIEFNDKFDIVTLIGVLEYAPVYFKRKDPLKYCIDIAKRFLKKNGKLIIAIENRLGLKYFLGFNEDHYGKPYIGIQNLYPPNGPKTLGKTEISKLLAVCGFKNIEFQYPFPDYKVPNLVVTEKAFQYANFNKSDLIKRYKTRDYYNNISEIIDESLIWPILEQNNLLSDLANSFLIIASQENSFPDNHMLAVMYTMDRKDKYRTETKFTSNSITRIKVQKRTLLENQIEKNRIISIISNTSDYIDGINLNSLLIKLFNIGDVKEFIKLLDNWVSFIIKEGLEKKSVEIFRSLIKSDFFDCIPNNIIIQKNKLAYIDREWKYHKPYSLGMLIIRGLYHFQTINALDDFIYEKNSSFGTLINKWFDKINLNISSSLVNEFVKIENLICDEVYGKEVWQPIRQMQNKRQMKMHLIFKSYLHKFKNSLKSTIGYSNQTLNRFKK